MQAWGRTLLARPTTPARKHKRVAWSSKTRSVPDVQTGLTPARTSNNSDAMVIAAHRPGSSPQAASAASRSWPRRLHRLAGCRPLGSKTIFAPSPTLPRACSTLARIDFSGTARARDRDLQLIWLFLCCVVGPEAGDHASGYEAIEGDVYQTAPGAIAVGHSVPPCQAASGDAVV